MKPLSFHFMKRPPLKNTSKSWGIISFVRHLWPYLRKHPWLLTSSVLCMLVYTFINRIFPFLIGYIIDKGIGLKQFSHIAWGVTVYAILMVIHTLCNFGQYYLFQIYGNRIVFYVRQKLVRHLHYFPMSFFDKNSRGKITNQVINDSTKLNNLFQANVFSTVPHMISGVSVLFVMFYISPKLSLIALSLSPFFLGFVWKINLNLSRRLHSAKRKLSTLNSLTLESLHGMKILQIHQKKEGKTKQFNKSSKEYRTRNFNISLQSARLRGSMTLFQASILTLSLVFGIQMHWNNAISIGVLTAFILNVQHLPGYLRMIFENYQALQDSITSAERIFSLLKQSPEEQLPAREAPATSNTSAFFTPHSALKATPAPASRRPITTPAPIPATTTSTPALTPTPAITTSTPALTPTPAITTSTPAPRGHLQVQNLSFRYGTKEPWVLKNISLNIEPGESVAILGRTGSGKSTLVSLLQKNYPFTQGTILLNGQSIKDIPLQQLRKQMSLICQDDFIFSGSILDNITLQDPSVSMDKVYEVVTEIGYLQMLQRTGRNLHFLLKEGGKNISMGEQQLIALTRIFVNEPQVVILDEANAYMDFKYEHLLQKLIQKISKKQTCIMISHKIHNIIQCDSILILNEGEIAGKGNHSQLLKNNPLYKSYIEKYFTLKGSPPEHPSPILSNSPILNNVQV